MLITTNEELRLCFPTHAIDSIDPFKGFLRTSELDFLKEKLGNKLYADLVAYYKDIEPDKYVQAIDEGTEEAEAPYPRLLFLCQCAIANDAFARAAGINALSLSNMGINVATTDDYATPSKDALQLFMKSCNKEAHVNINLILQLLEEYSKEAATLADRTDELSEAEADIVVIANDWKQSRYYFLASGLLIPTADILQQYVDFYDNREKFIQMLPDMHYIQDEQIAPLIGEDFCDYLVKLSREGTDNRDLCRIITRLRKCLAAYLEERTSVIAVTKDRKVAAHNEGERHIKAATEYCTIHQQALIDAKAEGIEKAPWYVKPDTEYKPEPRFLNNKEGNAIFVMPAMN